MGFKLLSCVRGHGHGRAVYVCAVSKDEYVGAQLDELPHPPILTLKKKTRFPCIIRASRSTPRIWRLKLRSVQKVAAYRCITQPRVRDDSVGAGPSGDVLVPGLVRAKHIEGVGNEERTATRVRWRAEAVLSFEAQQAPQLRPAVLNTRFDGDVSLGKLGVRVV